MEPQPCRWKTRILTTKRHGSNPLLSTIFGKKCIVNFGKVRERSRLNCKDVLAFAGNRTPVSRVAGENSTTEPPKPPYSTFASLKNSTKSVARNWTFSSFYFSPLRFSPNIRVWKERSYTKMWYEKSQPSGTHWLICTINICFDMISKLRFYRL